MSTVAVLPIKRFDRAKQRLAPDVPADIRHALAQAMATDVLATLAATTAITDIVVVTGDPEATAIAHGYGARVYHDGNVHGHTEAILIGLRDLDPAARVLLVPGDCPAVSAHEITTVLAATDSAGATVVVVPDRHGAGTNALVLDPIDVTVPAFGPGSFARHHQRARSAGATSVTAPAVGFAHDVDTIDDLRALGVLLREHPGAAPRTRAILDTLPAA